MYFVFDLYNHHERLVQLKIVVSQATAPVTPIMHCYHSSFFTLSVQGKCTSFEYSNKVSFKSLKWVMRVYVKLELQKRS